MAVLSLAFEHSEGDGVDAVPARLCIYLSFYPNKSDGLGAANNKPILTEVAYDLAEFKRSVDSVKEQLDRLVREATEKWG